jgi:hypothetical protein
MEEPHASFGSDESPASVVLVAGDRIQHGSASVLPCDVDREVAELEVVEIEKARLVPGGHFLTLSLQDQTHHLDVSFDTISHKVLP